MGLSKSEIFTKEQNLLSLRFKALAHPARLAIIQHVINQHACICTDLVGELGLAQATISQHLKVLKSTGILQGSVSGKSICYCIDPEVWESIQVHFNQFFNQSVEVDRCC